MLLNKWMTALGLGVSLLASTALAAENKIITIASLEWPPYTGAKLPEQGASVAVVKAAFKAMGYELRVNFYPWSRAVELGKNDPGFAGYFPEYFSDQLAKDFELSEPIGTGPLGLAQRKGEGYNWSKVADLASKKVGVVQDYVNTDEFDDRVAKKQQPVDVALDDTKNLLKLGGKRVDLAIVDKNVFNYLMKTDPQLASFQSALEMNPKILEDKKLYICFKKGAKGKEWAKILAEGLKKIDVNAIMQKQLGN
ncbi:substrate-binding periplasmic protein [Parachitinimonas caeni]|uniref:Transporter substrate-binding domain-containing protein n=1 Tax=Parachitinimonas caeni TaxID=3031301 RepID=A0ABT7E2N0_9NEIS|nr:transporter substrate-binding domain-containing protein [Parachitinimonas caeni]MDK2126571.1 transporter substrate-binding domain-containing protein [Parachitinimonas caeni]